MFRIPGESEAALQSIFSEAHRLAPTLILIDNIDLIFRDKSKSNEIQKQLVSCVLTLIDGVQGSMRSGKGKGKVMILAATARPQMVEPALRRPGRLDKEIEFPVPSPEDRQEILNVIMKNRVELVASGGRSAEDFVSETARKAHGMVGSDLLQVVKEAVLLSYQSSLADSSGLAGLMESNLSISDTNTKPAGGKVRLQGELILRALKMVSPSAIREVAVEVPNVRWADIGGMEPVKQSLKEVVEWPLLYPELFASIGMPPPRGVLLYGPPGCSKTLMAKALATESSMNFLAVKGPELLSKWLGESEKAVQTLFKRARQSAPSIVFFDEIDALAGKRGDSNSGVNDRVLAQLLTEIDGIQGLKRVIVIAATNRPDLLDKALLRPGRIDRKIYVPPPDAGSRKQILDINLSKMPLNSDVNIDELVTKTAGFSGAEVVSLCSEAAFSVIETAIANDPNGSPDSIVPKVCMSDLNEAHSKIQPQITPTMIKFYENLQKEFEI